MNIDVVKDRIELLREQVNIEYKKGTVLNWIFGLASFLAIVSSLITQLTLMLVMFFVILIIWMTWNVLSLNHIHTKEIIIQILELKCEVIQNVGSRKEENDRSGEAQEHKIRRNIPKQVLQTMPNKNNK